MTSPEELSPTPVAELLSQDIVEGMGVTTAAYNQVCHLLGRNPTIEELSTLIAMWNSHGRRLSFYAWLKGQPRQADVHEYLLDAQDRQYYDIKEPCVQDCLQIVHHMDFRHCGEAPASWEPPFTPLRALAHHGDAIYMVGDISKTLAHSLYATRYLHLVDEPFESDDIMDVIEYIAMILQALQHNGTLLTYGEVGTGGIFGTLVAAAYHQALGFDILSYREVRLDAFLFGEQRGRFLATLPQEQENFFLQKMDEARIHCCMLGKVTKGRILIDNMDFGDIHEY